MEVQQHHDFRQVRYELAVNQMLQHANIVRCLAYKLNMLVGDGLRNLGDGGYGLVLDDYMYFKCLLQYMLTVHCISDYLPCCSLFSKHGVYASVVA